MARQKGLTFGLRWHVLSTVPVGQLGEKPLVLGLAADRRPVFRVADVVSDFSGEKSGVDIVGAQNLPAP
ncbi:hypothetical protein [Micromonospora sp. KC606]|uniref:hypothetical protein n=1 Tax=Micromonospora sp. KC606 TaxID=2530379 RepID=UPI001FB6084E|nr:hypothetical protein [Micromonospora sp. KC606]